jgi:hypothetical protein
VIDRTGPEEDVRHRTDDPVQSALSSSMLHEIRLPSLESHARWKRCFDRLTDLRELALSLRTETEHSPADIELLPRLNSAIEEESRLAAVLLLAINVPAGISGVGKLASE